MFKEHEYSAVFRSHMVSLNEFNTMTALIGVTEIPCCQRVSYGIANRDILFPLYHHQCTLRTPTTMLIPWTSYCSWIPPWSSLPLPHDIGPIKPPVSPCFFPRLILLGVLLGRFCSSTAELYLLANHCMLSFYIHWPISVHFPYIGVSSSWLVPFVSSFLLWTLPTSDWLLCLSTLWLGLPFRVRSILYSGSNNCPNVCMFFTKVDNP